MRIATLLFLLSTFTAAIAQDGATESAKESSKVEAIRQERIEKFTEMFGNKVLVGRFTIDGLDDQKRRAERYEIQKVTKAKKGDFWTIVARMKYGDVDMKLPFMVEVKWAGKTPVITVDEMKLIGMKDSFDARIVLDSGKYAGTWRHGKVGGLMFGRIEDADKAKGDQDKVTSEQ